MKGLKKQKNQNFFVISKQKLCCVDSIFKGSLQLSAANASYWWRQRHDGECIVEPKKMLETKNCCTGCF